MNNATTVTVNLEDLRRVVQAADYMNDRSLIGPVDRLGDAIALATMKADLHAEETRWAASRPVRSG